MYRSCKLAVLLVQRLAATFHIIQAGEYVICGILLDVQNEGFQNTYIIVHGSSQIPIGYECQRGTSYKLSRIGNEISYIGFNRSRNEDNSTRLSLVYILLNFYTITHDLITQIILGSTSCYGI